LYGPDELEAVLALDAVGLPEKLGKVGRRL
jgi:hypothetical protein